MAPGRDPCLTSTTEHTVEAGSEQAKNGEHRQAGWKNAPRVGRGTTGVTLLHSASYSRVIISDTVDVVLHIHSEGHPIQALVAYRASEAAWACRIWGQEALKGQCRWKAQHSPQKTRWL